MVCYSKTYRANEKINDKNLNLTSMKKYQSILLAAFALASCSNNEIIEENISIAKNNEISFSTVRNKVNTRAANNNGSNYQVYATVSGLTTWFIDNTLTPSTDGGVDIINGNAGSTAPIYHYPTNGDAVNFYAYAPAYDSENTATTGVMSVAATPPTGDDSPSIAITYTVPSDADMDFTIANPVSQTSGEVQLSFQHALSQVKVTALLSTELTSAGYILSDGYLSTFVIPYNTATINAAYTIPTIPAATTTATPQWGTASSSPTGGATYSGKLIYNILPQSTTGCTLQLTDVTITNSSGSPVISNGTLTAYNITNSLADFVMGTSYTFTVTITNESTAGPDNPIFGKVITFSSSVADWASASQAIDQP